MQLGDILDDFALDAVTASIEVSSVEIDSRECEPGSMFFAIPGTTAHGSRFVADAVAQGAVAIVSSEPLILSVPGVVVPASQLQALMAHASATVTGHPETKTELVGVTGTNGKTSVTTLVSQLADALQWNAGNIGTLTSERTTPAPPELFRSLARLVESFDQQKPRSVVAIEVSSHALEQHRVDGLRFAVAGFTNLSHEHLDYHGAMEDYFAAKAQLFTAEHAQHAVIWGDDPYGVRLADTTSLPVVIVRRAHAIEVVSSLLGTTYFWRDELVNTPLVGDFNVDNALIAMAIMSTLGASNSSIASAMSHVHNVPGRFEIVSSRDVVVVVDYAHTPEGLRRLLGDVRELNLQGRIITVFGCGGDRDQSKRPEMGLVASTMSDVTIVTTDNARSESPDAIIDDIMSGVALGSTTLQVTDRRSAISEALGLALPGDIVVVAGKGHETTQLIGDEVLFFDDRAVIGELLK